MKIKCDCGYIIVDQTDYLPFKGYLIPDKNYFDILDKIDDAVESSGLNQKESALMEVRKLIGQKTKVAYQCSVCGTLYLEDSNKNLNIYKADSEQESKSILDGER